MRKRNTSDIWAGLYDFPLIESDKLLSEDEIGEKISEAYRSAFQVEEISADYQHILSHQKLHAKFVQIRFTDVPDQMDLSDGQYVLADTAERDKLPKPVLISRYLNDHNF
jgi:A/G-specific adenine glycosylase